MRRPLVSVALLYASGVVVGRIWSAPLLWLFTAAALALLTSLGKGRRQRAWLALALVFAGWTNYTWRSSILSPHDLREVLGDAPAYVTVQGRLLSSPEVHEVDESKGECRTRVVVDVASLRLEDRDAVATGRILASTPGLLGDDYYRGRSVQARGVLRLPPTARARELFDYRAHLADRGIYYELQCGSVHDWIPDPPGSHPTGAPWSDRFQHWARRALARGLPEGDASVRLLWAMLLGWRAGLTDELSQEFRQSGTMHIFAISGLHIGMITVILAAVCRALRVPRGLCWMPVLPALWFYAAATGWQPSAIRATLMSSLLLSGWSLRRPLDLLNSVAGAAWLILLWEPRQLFQVGFQLSFSVVTVITLMLPHLERLQKGWLAPDPLLPEEERSNRERRLHAAIRKVTGSLGISLAATLGSMPWMVYYFNICTPVSLLANLVVVPLAAATLMSGLASLTTAAWLPLVSVCYNHSAWLAMEAMHAVSHWSAELPGAWFYVGSPPLSMVLGFYGLLIALGADHRPYLTRRRLVAIGAGVLIVAGSGLASLPPAGVQLTVLPLRGGDSLFVTAPGSASDLLVDTGDGRGVVQTVLPFLRARGVNRLGTLALTHGDVRHVGGAAVIRDQLRVVQTITTRVPARSLPYRALVKELQETSAGWRQVERGDTVCGWRVLHPAASDRFSRADDSALVLLGEFEGVRVLICSDLGRLGQRTLLDREPGLRVDVIIAGMPSLDQPLSDGFLQMLGPELVVVSAGEYPASERPSAALRERLQAHGIPILFTCDHGAVYLTLRKLRWHAQAQDGRVETGSAVRAIERLIDAKGS